MKYTKNIGNKLKLMGFEMTLDSNELPFGVDDGLHYEIWSKGVIEVTLTHTPDGIVQVEIVERVDNLKISTFEQLKTLDKLINHE